MLTVTLDKWLTKEHLAAYAIDSGLTATRTGDALVIRGEHLPPVADPATCAALRHHRNPA